MVGREFNSRVGQRLRLAARHTGEGLRRVQAFVCLPPTHTCVVPFRTHIQTSPGLFETSQDLQRRGTKIFEPTFSAAGEAALDDVALRHVEEHRSLPAGALSAYAGRTLDDLYAAELLYNEEVVTTASATRVAVAAPFVTALAGALLAAEALKRSTRALAEYALGPSGPAMRYWEDPYASHHGWLSTLT